MEKHEVSSVYRAALMVMILTAVGGLAFVAGMAFAHAEEPTKGKRIVYPKQTQLDFEGAAIEGDLHNPGEFYFQHRPEEKFDSLVKRRKNFHKEILRDVVLSK
ncbi:MAG: hypothetical protein ACXWP5_02655 [Bdellovibrionota bacterium]